MLNRRINSERNVSRFRDDNEKEKKLSSILPDFLVKKYGKEDRTTPETSQKNNVFLEDENKEEGLEISIDHYMINETPVKIIFDNLD